MQLSEQASNAIRATWDFFCLEKELTKETEEIFADYLKHIADIAEGEAKEVAGECYSFWLGYCNTHACEYPRLSEYRFSGMYKRLEQLSVAAGAIIAEPLPDYPYQARPAPASPPSCLEDSEDQRPSVQFPQP